MVYPGVHSHRIGPDADLIDDGGQFRDAYAPSRGDRFLISPDSYVGPIVGAGGVGRLDRYLATVELPATVSSGSRS